MEGIFFDGFVLWVARTLRLARDAVRVSIYGAYPSRQSAVAASECRRRSTLRNLVESRHEQFQVGR